MVRQIKRLGLAVAFVSAFAFSAAAQDATPEGTIGAETATATVMNTNGEILGIVSFATQDGYTWVTAQLAGLTPGFHGFHVHTVGQCEDNGEGAFTAAEGHINDDGTGHPSHNGDMSSLFVTADGTSYLSFVTDYFTVADLLDADGSAVMVHANPDNFGNIPERYGTPDEQTLNTGDAGDRIACGVAEAGMGMGMIAGMDGTTDLSAEVTPEPTAVG